MKLDLHFGMHGPAKRITFYQDIKDFPTLVIYKAKKWEFLAYGEDSTKVVDYICTFGEVPVYDPAFHSTEYVDMARYLGNDWNSCECGAEYTSFPWDHFKMCRKWEKW